MTTTTTNGSKAMMRVIGQTYPIKEQLKALGARWDGRKKYWIVPAEVADAVKQIKDTYGRNLEVEPIRGRELDASETAALEQAKKIARALASKEIEGLDINRQILAGTVGLRRRLRPGVGRVAICAYYSYVTPIMPGSHAGGFKKRAPITILVSHLNDEYYISIDSYPIPFRASPSPRGMAAGPLTSTDEMVAFIMTLFDNGLA